MRYKSEHKKNSILSAAVEIFAEKGYHNSKIFQIAEKAEIASGSVYLYYEDKEDILNSIFIVIWENLLEDLQLLSKNDELSPESKLDCMIDSIFSVFAENPSLAIVFVNEQHSLSLSKQNEFSVHYNKFLDIGEDIIRSGIRAGIFDYKIDFKIFRSFIFGAIRNTLHFWAGNPESVNLDEAKDQIKYFLQKLVKI